MPTNRDRDKNTENIFSIPSEVAEAIKKSLSYNYPFNFGLYFNKWLWVCADDCGVDYKFQARPELKSCKSGNGKYQADEVLNYYGKIRKALNSVLMSKLKEREELCKAFEKIGYSKCSSKVKLETPLIVGLGNAHPTERGFTFHWTLGIPYIPAESVKGILRLCHLINKTNRDAGFFENWAREDEEYFRALRGIFGCSESENVTAAKGKVVFLDAMPVNVPELGLEITTCHYPEYYGAKRGPTEDQNPMPLPFLAVMNNGDTFFDFTFLVSNSLSSEEQNQLKEAFRLAISEHGFGAKTALGHGRFSCDIP